MQDCFPWFGIPALLFLNLIAAGLVTGHVDLLLRKTPFSNTPIWDMFPGCSRVFNWVWALFIWIWTAVFLWSLVSGSMRFC